jgi:TetR/AcrR family transcriptional repressor of nem operon
MRVSRHLQAEHRMAMLRQASRLFRAHGIAGVAVADITRAAGLTHGAFYGHFDSKAAIAAEACRDSLTRAAGRWRDIAATAAAAGADPLAGLVEAYLSESHRDHPGGGCALAALGAETVREPGIATGLGDGTEALLGAIEAILASARPAMPPAARPAAALGLLAAMNGGLQLARALADRPDRSRAALAAARHAALRAADPS